MIRKLGGRIVILVFFVLTYTLSLSVQANEITYNEVVRNADGAYNLLVVGHLEQKFSGEPVNLWMYKDDKIVRIEQAVTNAEGEYEFSVNMSMLAQGGTFKIKTIARIEEAAEKTFEFYSNEELEYFYKTLLFDEIDVSAGVTEKNINNIEQAIVDNAHIMRFIDKRYEDYICDSGYVADIAAFIAKEIEYVKKEDETYDKEKIINSLVYTAMVKNIEYTDDVELVKDCFVSKGEADRITKLNLLRLNNNSVVALFDANATWDAREDKESIDELSDYEYKKKESLYISLAENISAFENKYKDRNDFTKKVEDAIVVTEIEKCRGYEKLEELLFLYDDIAEVLDMTKYGNKKNDKKAVLKKILLMVEKSEIKTIAELQMVLDTNILIEESSKLPGNGGAGSGGGGGNTKPNYYEGSNSVVLVPETLFNENDLVKPDIQRFKDMGEYDWAKESVDALVELNMLDGFSNERFAPEENITRAQFAKMMCSVFEIEKNNSSGVFLDVEPNSWYAGYVTALHNAGYINGVDATHFGSEQFITRQDAFSIIYRIMKDKCLLEEEIGEADFFDWNEVADYAKVPVGTLSKLGLVQGSDGDILPNNKMIRAEGAVIMYRIYKEVLQ